MAVNGSEFTAEPVRGWLARLDVKTLYIEPGSPWENGYVESFNGKRRDELLDRETFYTLLEARVLIERWREHYNRVRPHSSLGYRRSGQARHAEHDGLSEVDGERGQNAGLSRAGQIV